MFRCLLAILLTTLFTVSASEPSVNQAGELERLPLGIGWQPAISQIQVVMKGWKKFYFFGEAATHQKPKENGAQVWTAALGKKDGNEVDIENTFYVEANKAVFEIKATSQTDAELEGIMFNLQIPTGTFAGGKGKAGDKEFSLPETLPADIHLAAGKLDHVSYTALKGKNEITLEFSQPTQVGIQDNRKWTQFFSSMVFIKVGSLPKGQSASLKITIYSQGEVDKTPAQLSMDSQTVQNKIDGIGGNYCFALGDVADFTLKNLKVGAARTELHMDQWAPKKPDGDVKAQQAAYILNDKPGSEIRKEFEMMQLLSQKKIPYTTTIWRMPPWMAQNISKGAQARWHIRDEDWPALLNAIGAYLLHAKEKYQAEPDYFSFNESDWGVDVFFTPEEEKDKTRRVGEYLQKLGFKTKILAGDTTNPRGTQKFVLPTLNDPEALKYVGAISYHSWGGASPEQYAAWADLAEKFKLPLFVAEAGPDAEAWKHGKMNTPVYATKELEHYMQLFVYSRAQSILLWEYTSDYSILERDENKKLIPTTRYAFQKHWTEFIPAGCEQVKTTGSDGHVYLAAYKLAAGGWSVHAANVKWEREVTITGIPASITQLNAVRTSATEMFKKLDAVKIVNGEAKLVLPAESVLTLTTLEIPELLTP